MPPIGPVSRAERPGFERKTLSRMYALPKALGCDLAILRVDGSHPRSRVGPYEVRGLAGELEPHLIDEVRCPVRLERPGGYGKMVQESDLELQVSIECGILQ